MDSYDMSHKLAYAGRRSRVPFITGPEYTNSVPGVPVLAELRIFIPPDQWSEENVFSVAREICRVLGATAQFDIGMTVQGTASYEAQRSAAGNVARLMKLDPEDPRVCLLIRSGEGDWAYEARFPAMRFEPGGADYWRTMYSTAAVKPPSQQ